MIGNYEVICGSKIEHFNREAPLMDYLKTLTGQIKILDKNGNDVTSKFIPQPVKEVVKEEPKKEEPIVSKSSFTPKYKKNPRNW